MKNLKKLTILLLTITLFNCSSSSDSPDLQFDEPSVTFDVATAIALPAGSDITNLVSFNGQPAATYTTELEVGGVLTVGRPDGLLATDALIYDTVTVFDSNGLEVLFEDNTYVSDDGNLKFVVPEGKPADYYDNIDNIIDVFAIESINASTNSDLEYKYNIEVMIERNGAEYGPFLIDPKIRIKRIN